MDLQIEYININEIKPYKGNAKEHPKAQIEQIKKSIQEFGFADPLGIWNGEIVEGNGRYLAAKELKMEQVPVIRLDELTDEQRRAYGLVHNQLTMNTPFNLDALKIELDNIGEIDLADMGFDLTLHDEYTDDFFNREEKGGNAKQEGNEEYNAFIEKFEPKKTTDDCYTPDNIYAAVADYVADTYGKNKSDFVRPFYPGGDYQKFKYSANGVVVDNPPFSILAEIIDFYLANDINFFLFAPALIIVNYFRRPVCCIGTGADVTYENGAVVNTSFITNLESAKLKTEPQLLRIIEEENKKNFAEMKKQVPKYEYPKNVITGAKLNQLSKYGVDFSIDQDKTYFIGELDSQKEYDKAIFGAGVFISDKEAETVEKAVEKPMKWVLSEREKEIIKGLG